MRTESFHVLRNPEIRPVQKPCPGRLRLCGQDEPLVDVAVRAGKVVSIPREAAVPDTAAFEAPEGVRFVEDQAMFMTPEPGVDPLSVQQAGQSDLQIGALILQLGEALSPSQGRA